MILKEISNLVYIDEITLLNNSENVTHFLSFPSNLIVPENFKSHFYTSEQIANYICKCKDQAVPSKFVKSLNLTETQCIKLSNSEEVQVTLLSDEKITGCLCYHFKNKNDITALYFGHFRNISVLENNKLFMDLISNGINYLYLDNTRIGSSYYTLHTAIDVVREINSIFLKYPNYKICMGLPMFGYEELIENLLKFYKISINRKIQKIYKMYHPKIKFYEMKNADIILCEDSATVEQLKERFAQKKVITVRLLEKCKYKLEEFNSVLGIKVLFYSPHMKICNLRSIIELIQPLYVKDIYSADEKIPNFYKQASLNWVKENNAYEENHLSPSLIDNVNVPQVCANITEAATQVFEPIRQRKSVKLRRSSVSTSIDLESEIEKLRNTNLSEFNGKTAISNIFNKDYILPKRKKSRKHFPVQPIIELVGDEIKIEEHSQDEGSDFDLKFVNSFNELFSLTSLHPNNASFGIESEPINNECPKKKITKLLQKNYELQMAKRREIENNKKNQKFTEFGNRIDIFKDPLDLELPNNAKINSVGVEMRVDENAKKMKPKIYKNLKQFGLAKSKELKTKAALNVNRTKTNQNVTESKNKIENINKPLDLELLNDVEMDSENIDDSNENIIQTDEPIKKIFTKKKTKVKTNVNKPQIAKNRELISNCVSRQQVLADNNEINQNIRENGNRINYNKPLNLELLKNVVLDFDCNGINYTKPLNLELLNDVELDSDCNGINYNKPLNLELLNDVELESVCNEINYNKPLNLELLNDVELDPDCIEINYNKPLNLELLNDVELDPDCIEIENPCEEIIISDDEKTNKTISKIRRSPYHIVDYIRRKIKVTTPKKLNYLDD